MNPLAEIIRDELRRHGPIPFARFMELALDHPDHGYYESAPRPIGRRGDFFTSVSVGPLFGELLAFQFADWLVELGTQNSELKTFELIEAGAHDGQLAADILGWFKRQLPETFERLKYVIVEPSPRRQSWQQEALRAYTPHVRWIDALSASHSPQYPSPAPATAGTPSPLVGRGERDGVRGELRAPIPHSVPQARDTPQFTGVLFSNELLDAFPVHCLGWDAQHRSWFEWGVEARGDQFDWTRLPLAPDSLLPNPQSAICNPQLQRVLPDAYTIELCPAAESWWRDAAQSLARGHLLTFDYGFTDDEWLRPERPHGTLRAYCDHHATTDALATPGDQDLTAHVNFSTLMRAGEAAGLKTSGFTTQGAFLTHLLDRARHPAAGFGEWTDRRTRQFHTLTHADHLGGRFRALVQRR